MKCAGVAVLALTSGCLITPIIPFGGGKSHSEVQHETVKQLTPPQFRVDAPWSGTVTTATIRVWADDDYRAQNRRWRQMFEDELDYANELLAAQLGVRLVAEYHTWSHHAQDAPLSDSLDALAAQDPGGDVLAVVGLTSSLSLVSATFEQLGLAEVSGDHLVIRGYADVEERKVFDRVFAELGLDEREAMYHARRRHATAALILHEIGHTLGAPHRAEPDTIMSAMYSDHSTSFDGESRALILATLDQRLHRAASRGAAPAVAIDLPQDGHSALVIVVDAQGRRLIAGNAVDDRTLDDLFRMSYSDDPQTSIIVQRSAASPESAISYVYRRANAAGLARVSTVER